MMRQSLRYVLVFVVGILVGLAAGAWGVRAMWHHKPPTSARIVKMLDHKLHFTEGQKAKAIIILDEEGAKLRALRQKVGGEFDALREQSATRMRAILDPEQVKVYDAMKRRFDRRRPMMPPPPDAPASFRGEPPR